MSQQTAPTQVTGHPGVAIQHAVHAAVRRDIDRLVGALGSDRAPAHAIRDYAAEFLFQLHHHHTFEDAAIWPLLGERLGDPVTSLLDRNLAEHGDVVAAVDAFTEAIGRLDGDVGDALATAESMRDVVTRHLAHEESDVIPLIPESFTLEDVGRFQVESAVENPPERFLPWLLESAPEPVASDFRTMLPAPVLELLTTSWMPVRQSTVDALLDPVR